MTIYNYTLTLKNYHSSGDTFYIEDNQYDLSISKYREGIPISYYSGSTLSNISTETLDQFGIFRIID